MFSQIYKRFLWSGLALVAILATGAVGYWFISGQQSSFLDVIYMTVITITTIGFSEIIDLSGNSAGRIFTIFIAASGIGLAAYIVTNFTALIVEGELTNSFRRMKMEKMAKNSNDHYIICGIGGVGSHILNELRATKRQYIIIESSKDNIEKILENFPAAVCIEGDATDDHILNRAGIMRAKGVFIATGDDNQNLVVSLAVRLLNPNARIVAQCNQITNSEKMKRVGVDSVVSPTMIGGLRMASEMIRPAAVSFLDMMLRDKNENFRVEEVRIPESLVGKDISVLNQKKHKRVLILAVKNEDGWVYNPPDDYIIEPESTLVFIGTPDERHELEKTFQEK